MAYGNTDSPVEIGDQLEVNYLLSGIYQISGERIKVDVELVEAQSGGVVWNLSFNELFTDIFELQSRIASKVFNQFSMADNQDQTLPTQNIEAYGHYLKGLELWSKHYQYERREKRAIEAEEQLNLAIQKDSLFKDPYVTLVKAKSYWIFTNRGNPEKVESSEYARVKEEVMNLKDYSENHFVGSTENTMIQALIAYWGISDYQQAQDFFEEVLINDPENYDAHYLLGGGIYKRKFMHQKAIEHLSKARQIDPGNAAVCHEMVIVFRNMGDYSSAEKAYQNSTALGNRVQYTADIFVEQGKSFPGKKELDPLGYYFDQRYFERDYTGIIEIVDTAKVVSLDTRVYWKTWGYFGLGIQDSTKYYGQFFLDNYGHSKWICAMLGMKENALELNRNEWQPLGASGSDLMMYSNGVREEIQLLSILGEYERATELLINLNRTVPGYGQYATLRTNPYFDKIKSEYPPFVEALNNLKIPPKLNLEGLIKL